MNYKILLNEIEFDKFVGFLPELQDNEVYYLSLFSRHKYCVNLPNTKDNQLVRFTSSKRDLKEKVRRLECPVGGYKRDGIDVPQEAIALYIAINPRNLVKANKNLLVELATRCSEGKFDFNPLSLARTAVHHATDRKIFVDFDYDGINPEEYVSQIKELLPDNSFRIVKTRGGFHLLVVLDKVKELKVNWFKTLAALNGCDVRGSNTLTPVVGCVQGDFVPKFYEVL
jgi:hypothetical protein